MAKILLIEDDITLCEQLEQALVKWSHEVVRIGDFSKCLDYFIKTTPELVVLDITLPVFDGFYWCTKIREISKVPILFLSSHVKEEEMVMAMTLGGDDYMTKPFKLSVLIAKINAMMRRTYDYKVVDDSKLSYNALVLDIKGSTLTIGAQQIELTKNELRMLAVLMEHSEQIVTRDQIMDSLWSDNQFINDNTLTVNMNRLRNRLSELGATNYIHTKKGQGYMLKKVTL